MFNVYTELSWTYQMSLALRMIDKQLSKTKRGHLWIQICGWLTFIVYILAECCSYYNTATTNEFWAGVEVALDGAAFLFLFPGSAFLLYKLWNKKYSSAKLYCGLMSIVSIVYPLYNFCIDVPMYMKRVVLNF